MFWSDDVALIRHPFRRYAALGEAIRKAPHSFWSVVIRIGKVMVTLGLFVSITTTGRVVPVHVIGTMFAWAFAPIVQSVALLVAARLFARGVPRSIVLDLYFAGHGPWLVVMWVAAGIVVLSPSPSVIFFFLLGTGVLPALLAVALGWGALLNVAMFRAGLGLSRAQTALATTLFYVLFVGQIVGYYLANDAIQPQLGMT